MTHGISIIAALALAGLTFSQATSAHAQEAELQLDSDEASSAPMSLAEMPEVLNNTAFGDWLVSCEALSVQRVLCTLQQTFTLTETGQLIARLLALPTEDGGSILLAQVPIGVFLPGGAVIRPVDAAGEGDAVQREMAWQRCLGPICEAAIQLNPADLSTLAGHERMLFGYRMDRAGDPIVLNLDMRQFDAGLGAIRREG